jgi:IgGFc binding protein
MQHWRGLVLASVVGLALFGACGGGDDNAVASNAGSGGKSDASAGGSGGSAATDSGLDGVGIDVPNGDGQSLGCSADLRSVIDASGQVVQTCPPDQGCASGKCVNACDAARQSHGSLGCDFEVPTPMAYQTTLPPCFAVAVANTWPKTAKITVTRAGTNFDVTKFARVPVDGQTPDQWPALPASGIPVDGVAVLFLSADPSSVFPENGVAMNCPVETAVPASTMVDGTDLGDAFQIGSDAPVSAFDILPFGGARSHFPSAELLFPTSAWGDNYVVIGTPPGTNSPPGPLWLQVLANQDGTNVQLLPVQDLPSGGALPAIAKNTTGQVTLAAGQYAQWELPIGAYDVSGTILLADKPVSVFSGNRFYRQQPTPGPGGESTHQQLVAVSSLASDYVGAPFTTRRQDGVPEPIRYRLVGTVDGTTLVFDPPVTGAPAALARGQIDDFQSDAPFRVASQDADHPFAAAQLMDTANVPSGSAPGASASYCATLGFGPMLGDEEFVVMLGTAQFLPKYVFFTDLSFNTTELVVVRKKTNGAFANVSVDCLGTLGGWTPVGTSGEYQTTAVDLMRGGVGTGSCVNGRHLAESDAPFGMTVWGLDCYSSYAYPAGGNAAVLTNVTVPPVPK